MNALISSHGMAGWCLTFLTLLIRGSTASRPPRQMAGFSPSLSPRSLALLRTASIRIRTRLAVSGFVLQIGWSTDKT